MSLLLIVGIVIIVIYLLEVTYRDLRGGMHNLQKEINDLKKKKRK